MMNNADTPEEMSASGRVATLFTSTNSPWSGDAPQFRLLVT
jgi:hypothetical protein